MLPPLSMDAVAAVEDLLLRGEWTQALSESRSILGVRIVQQNELPAMTLEEERVLSVYLQAVFELELDDEVETAATIVKAFAPLPCEVAIQWSKFLMAMKRRPMAQQALQELLDSDTVGGKCTIEQYAQAAEVLVLQVLLPDNGVDAARQFVANDNVLEDAAKLQLLRRIQTAHLASQMAGTDAVQSANTSQTSAHPSQTQRQMNGDASQFATPVQSGIYQRGAKENDDSSSYVMIGGTAIAVAVAAAGALRYREKIHECVSNLVPAISKGLADAKYALFDA